MSVNSGMKIEPSSLLLPSSTGTLLKLPAWMAARGVLLSATPSMAGPHGMRGASAGRARGACLSPTAEARKEVAFQSGEVWGAAAAPPTKGQFGLRKSSRLSRIF
jgi:hypothetical protein